MSMKAIHAVFALVIGLAVGITWLRTFWNSPNRAPATVIAAPVAAGLLGLGHWVAYDFSLGHWASDYSLIQAVFNLAVAGALLIRRGTGDHVTL